MGTTFPSWVFLKPESEGRLRVPGHGRAGLWTEALLRSFISVSRLCCILAFASPRCLFPDAVCGVLSGMFLADLRRPARLEPLRGQRSAPLTPPPACAVLQAQGALQSGSRRTWVSGRRQELVHYRSWLVGRTDEAVKNVITGKAPRPSRKPKGIATPQT